MGSGCSLGHFRALSFMNDFSLPIVVILRWPTTTVGLHVVLRAGGYRSSTKPGRPKAALTSRLKERHVGFGSGIGGGRGHRQGIDDRRVRGGRERSYDVR